MARLCARILARQAHKKSGGQERQALGRSRGGFSTKIHITVDGLGNPLRLRLTAGQTHESTQAQALVDWIVEQGALAVIPPHQRANLKRDYDTWLYRERHLIECFVNKLKHFRRVFSRFDKLASRYLGFLQLVCSLVWLR